MLKFFLVILQCKNNNNTGDVLPLSLPTLLCASLAGVFRKTKKNMKKRLILPLKKKWYGMIKSGEKPEEYRDYNDYWKKRLMIGNDFKEFDEVEFTLGYPKKYDKSRRMTFASPSIRIGQGKEKWGAENGKVYFVITWQK